MRTTRQIRAAFSLSRSLAALCSNYVTVFVDDGVAGPQQSRTKSRRWTVFIGL
jgi:hypothetical protein